MSKGIKKVSKVVLHALAGVVFAAILLILVLGVALSMPRVQSYVARTVVGHFSEMFGVDMSLDAVALDGLRGVTIKGLYVADMEGDTLLYARRASCAIDRESLMRHNLIVPKDVVVAGGELNLLTYRGGRSNLDDLIAHIESHFEPSEPTGKPLELQNISVSDFYFRLYDEGAFVPQKSGINYADMDIFIPQAEVGLLRVDGGDVEMDVKHLSAKDKSGAEIHDSTFGRMLIGRSGLLEFENCRLLSGSSIIPLRYLAIMGDSWKEYKYFNSKVPMQVDVEQSLLHPEALEQFVPDFGNMGLTVENLTASYSGVVNNFSLWVGSAHVGQSSVVVDATIESITDVDSLRYEVRTLELATSAASAKDIYQTLINKPLPDQVWQIADKLGEIRLNGSAEGSLSSLGVDVALDSQAGNVGVDGVLTLPNDSRDDITFKGRVNTAALELGRLLAIEQVGEITATAEGEVVVGDGFVDGSVNGHIGQLVLAGYAYEDITLDGTYISDVLKAHVRSADENLLFTLEGEADLGWLEPQYNFELGLERADIAAIMGPNADGSKRATSLLSCNVEAAMEGVEIDNIVGRATINDLLYVSAADTLSTEVVNIVANNTDEGKSMVLYSSVADVEWRSKGSYMDVIDYVTSDVVGSLPLVGKGSEPSAVKSTATIADIYGAADYSSLSVNLKMEEALVALLPKGMKLASDTSLLFEVAPSVDRFSLLVHSDHVAWQEVILSGVELGSSGAKGDVNFTAEASDLLAMGTTIPDVSVGLQVENASDIEASVVFSDNSNTALSGQVKANGTLGRDVASGDVVAMFEVGDSYLMCYDTLLDISAGAIGYNNGSIDIDNLCILSSQGNGLVANGCVSDRRDESLGLQLSDVKLGGIAKMLAGMEEIEGVANGSVEIFSALSAPYGSGTIELTGLSASQVDIDPLAIDVQMPRGTSRLAVKLDNSRLGKTLAEGWYDQSTSNYKGRVNISQLDVSLVGVLLQGLVSDIGGLANIELDIEGSTATTPQMFGSANVEALGAKLDFTNVGYSFEPVSVRFEGSQATLMPVKMTDTKGGSAVVDGTVSIANMDDLHSSLHMVLDGLSVMDIEASAGGELYGTINLSGGVTLLTGNGRTDIDAALTTGAGSSVSVLLQSGSDFAGADFVQFVSFQEQQEAPQQQTSLLGSAALAAASQPIRAQKANLNMDMTLQVGTDTELRIVLDPITDNVLEARGEADLNVTYDQQKEDFSIRGDYQISEGVYNFNFQNIIAKQFTINPDSYIRWNGGPMDATMDVSATYSLRTSLAPLLGTDRATARNSTPVDCIVNLAGQLSAIDLSFDINVPTANTEYQSILSNYFSSQEMMATQFVYLLTAGSFYSDSDTSSQGMAAAGSAGTAIGFDFLATQVSRLVSNDAYKFNLKYKMLDQTASTYGVDFQTEIIDDRLLLELEANVDTGEYYQTVTNGNQLSGGGSLTLMLDEKGNLILKGFSRTIDRFDENQGLQENGVGVYYKHSFDRISDLWRKKSTTPEEGSKKSDNFVPDEAVKQNDDEAAQPKEENTNENR